LQDYADNSYKGKSKYRKKVLKQPINDHNIFLKREAKKRDITTNSCYGILSL